MKFLTSTQLAQVKQIVFVAVLLFGLLFVLQRVTEGFAKSAEQYVSGIGPFIYTLNDLREMSGGKSKLSAIEFYDYFEKKDKSGKIIQKGFILQDDPTVGRQNETGGPRIVAGTKAIYAADSTRKPNFPIALNDPLLKQGIQISNIAGNLGGSTEPPLSIMDAKGRLVAKTQFDLKDRSKEEPGINQAMKIKFIFSD